MVSIRVQEQGSNYNNKELHEVIGTDPVNESTM